MDLAALIPSYGRPDKLRACLQNLATQSRPPAQTLVGLDGGSEPDATALRDEFAHRLAGLTVLALPKQGVVRTRAALLDRIETPAFVSLNDDVVLGTRCFEAHAAAQQRWPNAMVLGRVAWAPVDGPTVLDTVIERSGIIFFDPAAEAAANRGRLGYRHAVGLNLSCPTASARDAGGYATVACEYGHEDIELAYRLVQRGSEVRYEPEATAIHDHRYRANDLMRREYQLGRASWGFAQINPAFTHDLLRRDVTSSDELDFARSVLRTNRPDADRAEAWLRTMGELPADEHQLTDPMPELLATCWVPLKRYLWRWGLLDAAGGVPPRWSSLSQAGPLP